MSRTTTKKERLRKTHTFGNRKLRWRSRVKRHLRVCDNYAKEVTQGDSVGFSLIMEAAYRICQLGEEGIDLVTELNKLNPPKLAQTRAHIAALCNTLEQMSTVLEYLLDQQDLPKVHFPLYKSELQTPMKAEISELEATDVILQRLEQSAREREEESEV